jgi:hypothetical protein
MNIIDNRNLLTRGNSAIVIVKQHDKYTCAWRLYPCTKSLIAEIRDLESQKIKDRAYSRSYMVRIAARAEKKFTVFINRFAHYPAFTMESWEIHDTNDCILTLAQMYD